MEENVFEGLHYLISYPEGFREDQKYPLVIFLHGAGSRHPDTSILRNNSGFLKLQSFQFKNFLLMAPLCSATNWNEVMSDLIGLVDQVRNLDYVDTSRVSLTGNSMGGYGTWELASLRPDWFASIMPLCGGGIPGMANEIAALPIRAFHGLCDQTVDPIESLQMVKAVNNFGGNAELILFPKLPHNCWDAVYTDEANFEWMFSFTNEREEKAL